jgi:hypothetical protein
MWRTSERKKGYVQPFGFWLRGSHIVCAREKVAAGGWKEGKMYEEEQSEKAKGREKRRAYRT